MLEVLSEVVVKRMVVKRIRQGRGHDKFLHRQGAVSLDLGHYIALVPEAFPEETFVEFQQIAGCPGQEFSTRVSGAGPI